MVLGLRLRQFAELGLLLELRQFMLDAVVDLETLLEDPSESVNLLYGLSVALLLLLDDFEGPVLLTEDSVATLPFDPVHLHEVVCAPRTFNMERDHALAVLALDAGAFILLPADNALQVEPLVVDLVKTNGSLWSHDRPRYPHGAAQVHPLI